VTDTEHGILLALLAAASKGYAGLSERRASGLVGSNSSTGLPDGSSRRMCLPPTPMAVSLRKRARCCRNCCTSAARSSTSKLKRFQAPGAARLPSAMACPPPGPPPGTLNTSRNSPRVSMAKLGDLGGAAVGGVEKSRAGGHPQDID
jgi:hypothetical protein